MTHQIELEVITPVHVGMGMEKKLIRGLDFIYRDEEYHVLTPDRILGTLDRKEIEMISNYLAAGNYTAFSSFVEKHTDLLKTGTRYSWHSSFGNAPEIRPLYSDGAGKHFLPGSAIKGVLRGILLTKLLQDKGGEMNDTELMGRIENNLMRYLQVTDCYVDQTPGIYPVKVFSADLNGREKIGKWKDKNRNGHEVIFNSDKFVTYYEMLPDGENSHKTRGHFRINWGGNDFIRKHNHEKVPNLGKVFEHPSGIQHLFEAARENTKKHLEREIKYFENYQNRKLDESFFDELNWLWEQNEEQSGTSCIIRVGANVGWHSITGNWKFRDHIEAVEKNRGKIVGGIEKAYKTRKLGFDHNGEDDYRFFLPGFVKLSLVKA
jgi:CRISPR/Cas system CSM-associated protein Csm5 (group 7 of RAMP superfamily)